MLLIQLRTNSKAVQKCFLRSRIQQKIYPKFYITLDNIKYLITNRMNYFYQQPPTLQQCLYPQIIYVPTTYGQQNQYVYFYNPTMHPSINVSQSEAAFQSLSHSNFLTLPSHQAKDQKKAQINEGSMKNEKHLRKMQYIGRNDFSNMFKSFLFLVFKCEKTKVHIKNLINKMKLSITLNSFCNKLKRKFPDSKTYIGPKQIRNFFSKLEKDEFSGQKSMCRLIKVLLNEFLQKEYKLYVIKKYKGKNQSKRQIFIKCRLLKQQLFGQEFENE